MTTSHITCIISYKLLLGCILLSFVVTDYRCPDISRSIMNPVTGGVLLSVVAATSLCVSASIICDNSPTRHYFKDGNVLNTRRILCNAGR